MRKLRFQLGEEIFLRLFHRVARDPLEHFKLTFLDCFRLGKSGLGFFHFLVDSLILLLDVVELTV